ncbi:MAG TPA: hypothetical protein VHS97_25260 [Isosphaeraceae bacterium]|nr:hypothetical protein [Isosphaeraceae bacterium]
MQECSERPKRRVPGEDKLRGFSLQGRYDLLCARRDQGMAAIGLVAQQVIDEEMPGRAVEPRVKMQGTLPSPNVQPRIFPDRDTAADVAPHLTQNDPLPSPLVANSQLLRGHEQIVADLKDDCRADRCCQCESRKGRAQQAPWL